MKILLYQPHRQVKHIIADIRKEKRYLCVNMNILWKLIPLSSNNKFKFRLIGLILTLLNPSFILTANWISRYDAFYYLWTRKKPKTKYVVVQHGSYVGGIITVNSHKYIRSNIFLTWGSFHKDLFENLNSTKNIKVYDFGNPLYNGINREQFKYEENKIENVLIVNSGITEKGVNELNKLVGLLKNNNLNVKIKLHGHQVKKFGKFHYHAELEVKNSYQILKSNEYDLFIVDHSSFMMDAIFYKKKVVFFPQYDRGVVFFENLYSKFLNPINLDDLNRNIINLNDKINLVNQEKLFNKLITVRENNSAYPFDGNF